MSNNLLRQDLDAVDSNIKDLSPGEQDEQILHTNHRQLLLLFLHSYYMSSF